MGEVSELHTLGWPPAGFGSRLVPVDLWNFPLAMVLTPVRDTVQQQDETCLQIPDQIFAGSQAYLAVSAFFSDRPSC